MAKTSNNSSTKASAAKRGTTSADGKGLSSQMRILLAIAQQNRLGVEAPCRKKIASLAEMKNAGSYSTILGRMKKKGEVEFPDSKSVALTNDGQEAVAPHLPPEPKCNNDLHEELKKKISRGKSREFFDLLADGQDHTLAELVQMTNYDDETNKSF